MGVVEAVKMCCCNPNPAGLPCLLWPGHVEQVFVKGDSLRRFGQNSAQEYWDAHARGTVNFQRVEKDKEKSTFWVMRAQATEKEAAADATVSKACAEHLVRLLLTGGGDLRALLKESKVFQSTADGEKLSTTDLELLFHVHCVVVAGEFPSRYLPRCYGKSRNAARRVCTCSTFVQKANCPHVWYVAALQGDINLDTIPARAKPGRKRKSSGRTPDPKRPREVGR